MSWIKEIPGGVVLSVHASPRSVKSQVQGLHGNAVKVKLQAPPVDGKANGALVEFLAGVLGVPRRHVSLVSGATSRCKQVAIAGVSVEDARKALGL